MFLPHTKLYQYRRFDTNFRFRKQEWHLTILGSCFHFFIPEICSISCFIWALLILMPSVVHCMPFVWIETCPSRYIMWLKSYIPPKPYSNLGFSSCQETLYQIVGLL